MRQGCRSQEGQLSPGAVPSLRGRRGANKATGALAASILTIVYHMLNTGELYRDLGPHHFVHRAKAGTLRRLVTRLQNLGYAVQISPLAA
jgi:transposase